MVVEKYFLPLEQKDLDMSSFKAKWLRTTLTS